MNKIRKNLRKLSVLIVSLLTVSLWAELQCDNKPFFQEPLTEYTKKDWKPRGRNNDGIRFFKDANNEDFVLKYQSPASAVHDTLGAHIGTELGVSVNKVILLPAGSSFMGEALLCTATLHTHAPGQEITEIADMPYHVDIVNGLAQDTNLECITKNKTLRDIVALNIYLNRIDSHLNNTFLEKATQQFCAIDFGNIFHTAHEIPNEDKERYSPYSDKNTLLHHVFPSATIDIENPTLFPKRSNALAEEAVIFLRRLNKQDLSVENIDALKDLTQTLQRFSSEYPAEKIYDSWMKIADKANYTYSPQKKECIQVMVEYNGHQCKSLGSELDSIIKNNDTFDDNIQG